MSDVAKLWALAKQLDVPLTEEAWPGKGTAYTARDPEDIAHEIAHFLIATPEERTLPWYGLGTPPIASEHPLTPAKRRPFTRLRFMTRDRAETAVMLLGYTLHVHCGSPIPDVVDHARLHDPITTRQICYAQKRLHTWIGVNKYRRILDSIVSCWREADRFEREERRRHWTR